MTPEELNALNQRSFADAIGWVFEHSPWVAERAWSSRPFLNAEELYQAMVFQVQGASEQEQLALVQAHPDLAARVTLTEASASEQAGAGLDRLSPDEFATLNTLKDKYRQKFGFPFLFAVKGSTKHDILRALQDRLASSQEDEFAEALRQVYRIAAFRLHDYLNREG